MRVYIAADHAGYKLKEYLKKYFIKKNIHFVDLGAYSDKKQDDFPDFAVKVAKKISKDKKSKGILICGTGTGMVMAANRIKGARAALAYDKYSAVMSRRDNDANILCLRGRETSFENQKKIVNYWLGTDFSNIARYKRRIKKLEKIK